MSPWKFIPGKHARQLNFEAITSEQNFQKGNKADENNFIKKSFKYHRKQQWTTLAPATTIKNIYNTRKVINVAYVNNRLAETI